MAEKLSLADKLRIVRMETEEGVKRSRIAREVRCSVVTVGNVINAWRETGRLERKEGSGRPPGTDYAVLKAVDKAASKKRTATARNLVDDVEASAGRHVSARTILRARRTLGYRPMRAKHKP